MQYQSICHFCLLIGLLWIETIVHLCHIILGLYCWKTRLQNTYTCLTSNDCILSAINKWNNELADVLLDDLCVYDVFNVYLRTTSDSSVNWLQYRILHRILPVKYYLKKINITSSDSCTFCNKNSETIQHVSVKCKKTLPLWNALSACLYEKCSKRLGCNSLKIGRTKL